jgi:tetratricopeptide (TPR) repeat protein
MLASASEALATDLQDMPDLELVARRTLGETYLRLGLFGEAAADLERAHELAAASLGAHSAETMEIRAKLAYCRIRVRDVPDPAAIYRSETGALDPLLAEAERTLPPDHACAQWLLYALAESELRWRGPEQALSRWRALLDLLDRAPAERHAIPRAGVTTRLAFALMGLGRLDEAEAVSRAALPAEEDPAAWNDIAEQPPSLMLGGVCLRSGRLDEAAGWLRRTIEFQERAIGDGSDTGALAKSLLATCLVLLRRWEEALPLVEASRRANENQPGLAALLGQHLSQEAEILVQLDRRDEALERFERAIAAYRAGPQRSDRLWPTRSRAIVQLGLETATPWGGQALRSAFVSECFHGVCLDGLETFALDRYTWDRAEFMVRPWTGAGPVDDEPPLIAVTGSSALRDQPDPDPGLYLIEAIVPRIGLGPFRAQAWMLVADWHVELVRAARTPMTTGLEQATRLGPIESRRLPTLALLDSYAEGFGPDRISTHFDLSAATTVDLPSGRYRLEIVADDGVRAWVDGAPVIDRWALGVFREQADVEFLGAPREIRVEFFQHAENAVLSVHFVPQHDARHGVDPLMYSR